MFAGAGSIMNLRITLPRVGVVEIVQTYLPIAPLEQQVAFHWFAERRVSRLLAWNAVGGWVSQWRNDVRIWEEKAFTDSPDALPGRRARDAFARLVPTVLSRTGGGSSL